MKNKIIKNTLILTAITLVFGLLLGISYEITKEPIAKSQLEAKQRAYSLVMPEAGDFKEYADFDIKKAESILQSANLSENTIDEVVIAMKEEDTLGYVITTTNGNAYGGDITVSVGIAIDGTVTGIQFLSISETAGLGMNAAKPEFYDQFGDQQVEQFVVTKTGATSDGEIDALSGATITSNAVVGNVNAALAYFQDVLKGVNI